LKPPQKKKGINRRKGTELTRSASITLDGFMSLFPAKKNLQIIKEIKRKKFNKNSEKRVPLRDYGTLP